MSSITKHLPKKEDDDQVMTHVWVQRELRDKVNKKREQMDLTWSELQEALYLAFLDEPKGNKK